MNKSQSIIENTKKPETAKKLKVKDLTIQNPYDTETIERKTKSNMAKKLIGHAPKNANQFLHLMSKDSTIGLGGIKWAYKLRDYKYEDKSKKKDKDNEEEKNEKPIKTTTHFKVPSFFEDDQERYKNRNRRNKRPFSTNNNFSTVCHLTLNPLGGTVRQDEFNYSITLRENKPPKDTFINKNLWKDLPYKLPEGQFPSFLSPNLERSKEQLKKIDKYLYKPYNTQFTQIDYDNGKIYKKTMVKNKDKSYGGIGEHLSMRPYSSVYQDVNIFPNINLLDAHTNSMCLFELGLRCYSPITRHREKRITKDQFEKEKEERIKKKQMEARKYKKNMQIKLAHVFGEKVKKKE